MKYIITERQYRLLTELEHPSNDKHFTLIDYFKKKEGLSESDAIKKENLIVKRLNNLSNQVKSEIIKMYQSPEYKERLSKNNISLDKLISYIKDTKIACFAYPESRFGGFTTRVSNLVIINYTVDNFDDDNEIKHIIKHEIGHQIKLFLGNRFKKHMGDVNPKQGATWMELFSQDFETLKEYMYIRSDHENYTRMHVLRDYLKLKLTSKPSDFASALYNNFKSAVDKINSDKTVTYSNPIVSVKNNGNNVAITYTNPPRFEDDKRPMLVFMIQELSNIDYLNIPYDAIQLLSQFSTYSSNTKSITIDCNALANFNFSVVMSDKKRQEDESGTTQGIA